MTTERFQLKIMQTNVIALKLRPHRNQIKEKFHNYYF